MNVLCSSLCDLKIDLIVTTTMGIFKMTISEYLKTTESKIMDLQYKLKLELELKQAEEQVENLKLMLKSWDK